MNEEEYKKCLAILINNLEGNCCDFRPISYEFALKLAQLKELLETFPDDYEVMIEADCCDSFHGGCEVLEPGMVWKDEKCKELVFTIET